MFGFSLIAALGTAFLAGPTLAGETESAWRWRCWPARSAARRSCWASGSGWSRSAAASCCSPASPQFLVVRATVGYWPPDPVGASPCWPAQTVVLLTLALLLSTVISPMASGIVAVGLFGATWVGGHRGRLGGALGNDGVARVGTVSRMLLPTDGLWRGAMNAFQDPARSSRWARAGGVPVPQRVPAHAAPTSCGPSSGSP